jgi:rhodanese-related sulfurtransferase
MTRTTARALAVAAIAMLGIGIAVGVGIASHSTPASTAADAPEFDGSQVSVELWAQAVEGEGVVVLDVRTPEEYATGHIAGAVNVDVSAETFLSQAGALDPAASYGVYCRSGNRSQAAIDILTGAGFSHLLGLDGGITAWEAAGKPIATS